MLRRIKSILQGVGLTSFWNFSEDRLGKVTFSRIRFLCAFLKSEAPQGSLKKEKKKRVGVVANLMLRFGTVFPVRALSLESASIIDRRGTGRPLAFQG